MSSDIWTQCEPRLKFTLYRGHPWRVVESQEVISTRKLVSSRDDHEILEDLIESAKPAADLEKFKKYDYLLWTPFRYRPLRRGSRLGAPQNLGIWYGSEAIETALAEKAYYIFLLRSGTEADLGLFQKSLTVFKVSVSTKRGVDLTRAPFGEFAPQISSPISYAVSQEIGENLRARSAEVICFRSARDPRGGKNVAVLDVAAFRRGTPERTTSWFAFSSEESVEFKIQAEERGIPRTLEFALSDFWVAGKLPHPQFG